MDHWIKVKDMPPRVRDACIERGHSLDMSMSPKKAISEFSGWHLGDTSWGQVMVDYYVEMTGGSEVC